MLKAYPRTKTLLFAMLWAAVGLLWGMHYGYKAGEISGFREGVEYTISEVERITQSKR